MAERALHSVPGPHGPFAEIRTYEIAPGGLPETESTWERVVDCWRKLSLLLMVTGSIDTQPTCMMHFQPWRSLDDRARAQAEANSQGIWPPPDG